MNVEHCWTTGQGENAIDHSYKMHLPTCDDPSNVEQLLCIVDQFLDDAHDDRLHLSTGVQCHTKFRDIIGSDLRIVWQGISDAQANETVDTFRTNLDTLVEHYFAPTAHQDQLEYLCTAAKPFQMSCKQLVSCLRVISHLDCCLPSSLIDGVCFCLFATDDALKCTYFSLMPASWKNKFAESGQILNDVVYEYQNLSRFMAIQEVLSKCSHGDQSGKHKAFGCSGGHRTGGR